MNQSQALPKQLCFFEAYSGSARVAAAHLGFGFEVRTCDKKVGAQAPVTPSKHFKKPIREVLQKMITGEIAFEPHASYWAPECASMSKTSRATHYQVRPSEVGSAKKMKVYTSAELKDAEVDATLMCAYLTQQLSADPDHTFAIENPAKSLLWTFDAVKRLGGMQGVSVVVINLCMFGRADRNDPLFHKDTTIMTNNAGLAAALKSFRCKPGKGMCKCEVGFSGMHDNVQGNGAEAEKCPHALATTIALFNNAKLGHLRG